MKRARVRAIEEENFITRGIEARKIKSLNRQRMTIEADQNFYLGLLKFAVVYDPITAEDGGFKPGAKLSVLSVEHMIKANTLRIGAILENIKNGKQYIVKRREYIYNKRARNILKEI